ncbi:hypothetical protein O1M54_44195 [Streptomyces diastatochromogenes]|nr:hypothetical protein [Streptomyces diastatochromogenes]
MDVSPNSGKDIDARPAPERARLLPRRTALMDRMALVEPAAPARSQLPQNPPNNSSSPTAAIPTRWPARTTPTPSRPRGWPR